MLPQQKEALVALGSAVAFGVLIGVLIPLIDSFRAEAVFIALVAFILGLWIGRAVVGLRTKALDERDMAIRYKAGMVALHGFGAVVMVGAVVLFFLNRGDLLVPVVHVALLAFVSWIVMYMVWAVTVLILYRKVV
ncbi:MAG: hypothetical protein JW990_02875 [Thermoleophilia bacterium]|nr:hypothetical protein [Thermoleophilia bacterium]